MLNNTLSHHTQRDSKQTGLVFQWFHRRFGDGTPAQNEAWPILSSGKSLLLASPTGTGKTFAAFLGVLNALAQEHASGSLQDAIRCIYVSPLRALGYDLEKNLSGPLHEIYGDSPPIRVELRTGDTSAYERSRQFNKPPHILLTTPESLCLLLSQSKWLGHLAHVRWLIVDEIHSLAENKRGAHLALSVERLEANTGRKLQRIGLSATIHPLQTVAQFLSGTRHNCAIIDASAKKRIDLQVFTPLRKNPYPEAGYTGERLVKELGQLISKHRTTLVFCNTRSGAEGVAFWLKSSFPDLADSIECHHASLEREVRRDVEDRLKRGELRAVICSTSLEMGIDIGSIDLVVMLSTPKGVSKALQRAGRAGHNIHAVSRGILMATNVSDLVESCATVLLARQRHLDEIRLPDAPLDILAQHLVSMGCTARWNRSEAFQLVRRAYPYRNLTSDEFNDVLEYLAGGGASLRAQYTETFGKIHLDEESFETRSGTVRRDFLQNVGVIPSVGVVRVRLHTRPLGMVEESFIRMMKPGDIFILAGRAVRLERVSRMEAWVSNAKDQRPTVPRWNANKMPLSNRVCREIIDFRSQLRDRLISHPGNPTEWIAGRLDCGIRNAEIVWKIHAAQLEVSELPTADFLLVEEFVESPEPGRRRKGPPPSVHYFFHTLIGRTSNDAMARVLAFRMNQLRGGNAVATPHDYGFILTVTPTQRIADSDFPTLLDPDEFERHLHQSLQHSDMLKYHFRNAAQTGLMVYRNYFGEQKSVRKLAWSAEVIFNVLQQHEPDHVLLREARKDSLSTFVDCSGALEFLRSQQSRPVRLRSVSKVPPLAFAMYATKIKEALLIEDPFEVEERLFHQWWNALNEQSTPET